LSQTEARGVKTREVGVKLNESNELSLENIFDTC
jgi:hypothetical protein